MVDLTDRLNILLKQDRTHYSAEDYLDPSFQQMLLQANDLASIQGAIPSSSTISSYSSSQSNGINESWREKICEWSYQVVDHFDFSREVVSISISFLDRYLSVRAVDKRLFQLAAMTSLYMTIKIYERGTLSMSSMIDLSRGFFMVEHMAAMEFSLCQALQWHVHPPTPFCIARHFLHLIPVSPSCPLTVRHEVLEHARFLTELSVIDYFFVTKRSASVALAALLNAMDNCRACVFETRHDFLNQLKALDDFDPNDPQVEECRERLRDLYEQGGYAANGVSASDHQELESEQRAATVSPVSVAFAFSNQGQVQSDCNETDAAWPSNQLTRTVSDSASYGDSYYGVRKTMA